MPDQSGPIADECVLAPTRNRLWGFMGPVASSFTLAWLATHRGRLRTLILGGRRLSVLVVWDRKGTEELDHSEAEVDALRTIVYGEST